MKNYKEKTIAEKAAATELSAVEFFNNPTVRKYYGDSVHMVTNSRGFSMDSRTIIDTNNVDYVGYTDGKTIHVFPMNPFFTKDVPSLAEHAEYVMGVLAHEAAHRLFTGFKELKRTVEKMEKEGEFAYLPVLTEPKEVSDFEKIREEVKKNKYKRGVLVKLISSVHNIIEDGYIEEHFLDLYNGEMADALCLTREHQFYGSHTVRELINSTDNTWAIVSSLMLSYAKYGNFLVESLDELKESKLSYVTRLFPTIDEYMSLPCGNHPAKMGLIIKIIVQSWDILEDEVNQAASESEELEKLMETISKALGSMGSGDPQNASGDLHAMMADNDDEGEDENGNGQGSSSGQRSINAEALKIAIKKAQMDKSSSNSAADDAELKDGDDNTESKKMVKRMKAVNPKPIEKNTKQEVVREECGRIDNVGVDGMNEDPDLGSVTKDIIQEPNCDQATVDIENLINKVKESKAIEALEDERIKSVRCEASKVKLSGIHSKCHFAIHRIGRVSEDAEMNYKKVAEPLLQISKKLQKDLRKKLKEAQRGEKQTGLISGRRIQSSRLYKDDCRSFYNTKMPMDKPKLSIGILIDESGSMRGNDRATYARSTAIILEDFCRGLDIPCCIYGHSTGMGMTVDMYNYVSFDSFDKKDRYRLMDISARGGNRDGAALSYVGREMLKRPEECRIIILISDGQPADTDYYGEAAEEDLRSIKKSLNRAGIPLFAAAIGADKENIHRIYGDGFMDISNLEDMPRILTNLIKKFVRV